MEICWGHASSHCPQAMRLDQKAKTVTLTLSINTEVCAVMDYFEIFLQRMLLCRKAAEFFGLTFKLDINGLTLL